MSIKPYVACNGDADCHCYICNAVRIDERAKCVAFIRRHLGIEEIVRILADAIERGDYEVGK